MKKIIYVSLLIFLNVNICYSQTIDYVCTNSENNFVRFYKIDIETKTVFFSKSKISDTDKTTNKGESFIINRYEKIFDWDFPYVWTYENDPYSTNKNYTFNYFNFKLNQLRTFSMDRAPSQLYNCF